MTMVLNQFLIAIWSCLVRSLTGVRQNVQPKLHEHASRPSPTLLPPVHLASAQVERSGLGTFLQLIEVSLCALLSAGMSSVVLQLP